MRQHKIYPQRPLVIDKDNTKTIGYFGDSFCANSISDYSWCRQLAKKLGCGKVTHWGTGGTSVWYMFLKFKELLEKNELPRYIIILYTDPDRIYHPDVLLPAWAAEEESYTELEKAADLFRKHLDFPKKNAFQYQSSIQWFDQNILKKLEENHKIVQAFSLSKPDFVLKSGKILEYPLMPIYLENIQKGHKDNELYNHLTPEQNKKLAEKFTSMLSS